MPILDFKIKYGDGAERISIVLGSKVKLTSFESVLLSAYGTV